MGLSENYQPVLLQKKTHYQSCWDVKRCFDFRVQTGMTHRLEQVLKGQQIDLIQAVFHFCVDQRDNPAFLKSFLLL